MEIIFVLWKYTFIQCESKKNRSLDKQLNDIISNSKENIIKHKFSCLKSEDFNHLSTS